MIRRDVGVGPRNRDVRRAGELCRRVERHGALEKVVGRVAIEERSRPDEDQPLLPVRDIEIAVHRVHLRLLVDRQVRTRGVHRHRRRRGDGGGVAGRDREPLSERRDGSRLNPLGESLVVDVGHVVDDEARRAAGGVKVLPAKLERPDVPAAVRVGFLQAAPAALELAVALRIGNRVEGAPEDGLRLLALGHRDGSQALRPLRHVGKAADEVVEVRAEHQQLGHLRVVVVGARQMAVRAGLRLAAAPNRVRVEGRERRPGETFGRDGLLLRVEPLPVLVLRIHEHGARGAHGRHVVAVHGRVMAEHEDVVPKRLEVVGRPVARARALEMKVRLLPVGRHGQVAAEAGRDPRGVAGLAGDTLVGVGEVLHVAGEAPPRRAVRANRLGQPRPLAVVLVSRSDRVDRLHDFPLDPGVDRGLLQDLAAALLEPWAKGGRELAQVGPVGQREGRRRVVVAVTVDAPDLRGGARFAVELPVPVAVPDEMAVDAVHALFQVDVLELHRLLELPGILESIGFPSGSSSVPFESCQ